MEKLSKADSKALAQLMNYPQFHRIKGAVDNIANRGFGYAGFCMELVLRHAALVQQLCQPHTDSLIQFQAHHHPHTIAIIQIGFFKIVQLTVLLRDSVL